MPTVACPACLEWIKFPKSWAEPAFTCPHCHAVVNTADAPRETSRWFRFAVVFVALWVGILVGIAEAIIDNPGKAVGKPNQLAGFSWFVTTYGVAYVTALLLYRWFGSAADVADLWRGDAGRNLAILNAVAGVWLISQGWQAIVGAIALRPSLVVGLVLFWLGARGVWQTTRSNRSVAHLRNARRARNRSTSTRSSANGTPPSPSYPPSLNEVMTLARSEAVACQQDFISTAHLLLALAALDAQPAGQLLAAAGATPEKLRIVLAPHPQPGSVVVPAEKLPLTPTVRRAIQWVDTETRLDRGGLPDPEDLLLVLLAKRDGIITETLLSLRIDTKRLGESLTALARPRRL